MAEGCPTSVQQVAPRMNVRLHLASMIKGTEKLKRKQFWRLNEVSAIQSGRK
jgi:hypothetical protein